LKTLTELKRGDTRIFPFQLKENNVAMDITGGTIFFTMKKSDKDSDALAVISKATVCNGTTGTILLTHGDTVNLEERMYVCDFQFVSADNSLVITELATLKVINDVTIRVAI